MTTGTENNISPRIVVGLVSIIIALGTTLVATGFWAGAVRNELKNTKEELARKVDADVYDTNNNRIDQIILTLNNTDTNLAEQMQHMSDKIDKIYDILRTGK